MIRNSRIQCPVSEILILRRDNEPLTVAVRCLADGAKHAKLSISFVLQQHS